MPAHPSPLLRIAYVNSLCGLGETATADARGAGSEEFWGVSSLALRSRNVNTQRSLPRGGLGDVRPH